jgi:hypothetical protein
MARLYQVTARLTRVEYQVLADWLDHQDKPDPDLKLTVADAIRQAIKDMAAAQVKREHDRTRRRSSRTGGAGSAWSSPTLDKIGTSVRY